MRAAHAGLRLGPTYNETRCGIFPYPNTVSKAPSKHLSARVGRRARAFEDLGQVEDADLALARFDSHRVHVEIRIGTPRNEEEVRVEPRDQESSRWVAALVHAIDDTSGVGCGALVCVVVVGEDIGRRRGE